MLTLVSFQVIRPVDEDGNKVDDEWDVGRQLSNQASQVALEAEELALLGLTPVKGLLLYGPVRTVLIHTYQMHVQLYH